MDCESLVLIPPKKQTISFFTAELLRVVVPHLPIYHGLFRSKQHF